MIKNTKADYSNREYWLFSYTLLMLTVFRRRGWIAGGVGDITKKGELETVKAQRDYRYGMPTIEELVPYFILTQEHAANEEGRTYDPETDDFRPEHFINFAQQWFEGLAHQTLKVLGKGRQDDKKKQKRKAARESRRRN